MISFQVYSFVFTTIRKLCYTDNARSGCYNQRNFTDMIAVQVLRRRTYHGLSGWILNDIRHVLRRGRQREICHRRGAGAVTIQAEPEWCGHKPRHASNHQDLQKPREEAWVGLLLDFSLLKLICDVWLPELWENTFLCLLNKFVLFIYLFLAVLGLHHCVGFSLAA